MQVEGTMQAESKITAEPIEPGGKIVEGIQAQIEPSPQQRERRAAFGK